MAIPAESQSHLFTPIFKMRDDHHHGLHNNVFRPPLTPGSPYCASPIDQLSVSRKRLRTDSSSAVNTSTAQGTFAGRGESWSGSELVRATSPAPLANPRYTLAGGFDTPTLAATAYYEKAYSGESDFRKRWDTAPESPLHQDDVLGGPLARERNGHSRLSSSIYETEPQASSGWGKFVLGLASTVAGRIVNFCRESAFRGFHAGEGKGYDFSEPTELHVDHSWDGYFKSTASISTMSLRGRDFSGDFEQDNIRSRPAKRLHTDTGSGWVLVDSDLHTREGSPRLAARKTSASLLGSGRPVASRASGRRSLIPMSRRTSSQVTYTGSPLHPQSSLEHVTFSPVLSQNNHERRASTASTRSPISSTRNSSHASRVTNAEFSPRSPQTHKISAKRDRHEIDADKSMRKMNKQLQDLIRQGQAALGTKYEIEDEDMTEMAGDADADGWEDAGADAVTKW